MITKTRAYTSSDGQVHATLEAAQRAELAEIFATTTTLENGQNYTQASIISLIFANADKIKDVLTTSTRSRPGARSINGATRTRKTAKPPVTKPSRAAHVAGDYAKMRAEVEAAAPVNA